MLAKLREGTLQNKDSSVVRVVCETERQTERERETEKGRVTEKDIKIRNGRKVCLVRYYVTRHTHTKYKKNVDQIFSKAASQEPAVKKMVVQ